MHTTIQILDAISAKHGGATDYRVSKLLGTSTGALANWRTGRTTLSHDYALRAAAILDWDPAYVMACMEFERAEKDARLEATDEIKATWSKIAERFKPATLAVLAATLLGAHAAPSRACEIARAEDHAGNLYIMRSRRRLSRWLARRFGAPLLTLEMSPVALPA